MMAFDQNFVVSLILDDKPVREFNVNDKRTCRIPFNSEYKIRIKNNRPSRAWVIIDIDGMGVFAADQKLLLNANQSFDIERFVSDMKEGNKFKFVQATGANGVQDPTSKENGLIRVTFWPEKLPKITLRGQQVNSTRRGGASGQSASPSGTRTMGFGGEDWVTSDCSSAGTGATVDTAYVSNSGGFGACMDFMSSSEERTPDVGATVEGSKSNQAFATTNVDFPVEAPVVIDIWMKGSQPVVQAFHDKVEINIASKWIRMNGVVWDLIEYTIDSKKAILQCPHMQIVTENFVIL